LRIHTKKGMGGGRSRRTLTRSSSDCGSGSTVTPTRTRYRLRPTIDLWLLFQTQQCSFQGMTGFLLMGSCYTEKGGWVVVKACEVVGLSDGDPMTYGSLVASTVLGSEPLLSTGDGCFSLFACSDSMHKGDSPNRDRRQVLLYPWADEE